MKQGGFLASPLSDLLCVALFAAAGAAARVWVLPVFPFPPLLCDLLAAAIALLGPIGCGIERGLERPPGWGAALFLGLASGATWAAVSLASGWAGPATWVTAAALPAAGAVLARFATRFDRGETGWRVAVRQGPPTGTAPLALAIAAWRLPGPLGLLLLPLSWALRLPALLAIRLYQLTLSRLMPPACRFEPTCSRYGYEAFLRHGCVKGGLLTGLRVVRCSPLSPGGYDPVPHSSESQLSCQAGGSPR